MRTITLEVTDEELHALAYQSQHVAPRRPDGSEVDVLDALATRVLPLCAENGIDPEKPYPKPMTLEEAREIVEGLTVSVGDIEVCALHIILDAIRAAEQPELEPEPEPEQQIEVGDWARGPDGEYCQVTRIEGDLVFGYWSNFPAEELWHHISNCTILRKAGDLKVGDEFERLEDHYCRKWPARKRGTIVALDRDGWPITADGTCHYPHNIRIITPVEVRQ